VALLSIPEAAADAGQLSDLRMLAEGFFVVAGQKATPAPASAPAAAPAVASARIDAAAPSAHVRTAAGGTPSARAANAAPQGAPALERTVAADAPPDGITLPVALDQTMPAWNPPSVLKWRAYRGSMRIVIDNTGAVASADIVTSVNSTYDAALLQAARRWRYIPAKKDGQPIAYEKTIEVAISPSR
jgi:protein TonB